MQKPLALNKVDRVKDQWEKVFPKGTLVKTVLPVIDPVGDLELPPGSLLIVDEIISQNAGVWVNCKLIKGSFASLWSIRPGNLKLFAGGPSKKGRYKIAIQNVTGEFQDEIKVDPI